MISTKILAAGVGAVACVAITAAVSPAPAYADNGYFYLPCIAQAVSGPGMWGTGCAQYGAPQWVQETLTTDADGLVAESLSHIDDSYVGMHDPYFPDDPITQTLNKWADECGARTAFAVILAIGTDTEDVVAPRAFAGCAKSKAKDAVMSVLSGGTN